MYSVTTGGHIIVKCLKYHLWINECVSSPYHYTSRRRDHGLACRSYLISVVRACLLYGSLIVPLASPAEMDWTWTWWLSQVTQSQLNYCSSSLSLTSESDFHVVFRLDNLLSRLWQQSHFNNNLTSQEHHHLPLCPSIEQTGTCRYFCRHRKLRRIEDLVLGTNFNLYPS